MEQIINSFPKRLRKDVKFVLDMVGRFSAHERLYKRYRRKQSIEEAWKRNYTNDKDRRRGYAL